MSNGRGAGDSDALPEMVLGFCPLAKRLATDSQVRVGLRIFRINASRPAKEEPRSPVLTPFDQQAAECGEDLAVLRVDLQCPGVVSLGITRAAAPFVVESKEEVRFVVVGLDLDGAPKAARGFGVSALFLEGKRKIDKSDAANVSESSVLLEGDRLLEGSLSELRASEVKPRNADSELNQGMARQETLGASERTQATGLVVECLLAIRDRDPRSSLRLPAIRGDHLYPQVESASVLASLLCRPRLALQTRDCIRLALL